MQMVTDMAKPSGSVRKKAPRNRARAPRAEPARHGPERKCIVTGALRPAEELIRFVLGPDDIVVPDLKRKLEGRGVWVTATKTCVMEAAAKNLFARGFRRRVVVPDDLTGMIDAIMERSCIGALGLARKAGAVILGQTKVEAAARKKPLGLVLHAGDGSLEGRRKIRGALLAGGKNGQVAVFDLFTSEQLGLAFGQTNVVHAALSADGMAVAIAKNCRRLLRFREYETSGPAADQLGSRPRDTELETDIPSGSARTE